MSKPKVVRAVRMVRIWIPAYRPFIMGGDVNAPVCAEFEGTPVDLGRKLRGYSIPTPAGGVVIADAKSGGIVGNSLEEVRKNVAEGKMVVMRRQIADAVEKAKTAVMVKPEEFWRYVKGATNK